MLIGTATYYVEIWGRTMLQRRLFDKLRERVQPTLDDPTASEEHKARLRKEVEAAERALVQQEARRMRMFGRR